MDTAHFKKKLLEKESELVESIARKKEEARETRDVGVGDLGDVAITDENQDEVLQASSIEWQTLTLVREALQRIEDGTYGISIDSGKPIEPARLEAVPWTPYNLADQKKHDTKTE
jgi:DnaK suppressor protein